MNQKIKEKKKSNSIQTLSESEEKNGLCISCNSCVEKEKDIVNNIKKRPKTFENKTKNNKNEYKIGGYLVKTNLGEGTFGKVKLGIYIKNGEKVAIKIINKKKLKQKNDQIHLKREIDLLQKLNHINIISVYEIFENIDNYYIVMEYCSRGELFNYIVSKHRLNENEAAYYFYQLINGLEYIHSVGISHRDIKPENLLLTNNYILKIIDFGLSNYYQENINKFLRTPCGSPCYSSPEMVSGKSYDGFKVDIWSCGIVLFAMLCGYLPFDDKNDDKNIFKKIVECEIKYPFFLSDIAKDMITKLLIKDPNKRINIKQIKNHPFYIKGKKKFEVDFGINNKSKIVHTFTERTSLKLNNNNKKEDEGNENKKDKKNENNIKNRNDEYKLKNIKRLSNYSIDENYDNSQKELCYIPIETDVQEHRKNEKNFEKINNYQKNLHTENGLRNHVKNDKKPIEKINKNNTNFKEKKLENKSKEKFNINKLLRKNILSILINHKKTNKNNTKLNIIEKKNSINNTNIIPSLNNNQKLSYNNINIKKNNNNIHCISSSENQLKKAHSKVKEKVSKLTKNFDINTMNIQYLNTDINEIDKKKACFNKKEYLQKFISKPKSNNNNEECKNNIRKNYLLIETNYSNVDYLKNEKNKSNKNSNKNSHNNYYMIKNDSINNDKQIKSINTSKNKMIIKDIKEVNNYNYNNSNNILNFKSLNQINKRNTKNMNKYFNLPLQENDFNSNNLINIKQSLNKYINKDIGNNKTENDIPKKRHMINNTLSNLNENFNFNDLNIFNQRPKNKRNHNINIKNSKDSINIKKIKKSISKKNKLIALTKKKSFFTIRDTVINFDAGNGKIIILPTLNKSRDNKKEKEKEREWDINKKSKSLQGLQKSSTNTKTQSNYLIKKMKKEKLSASLLTNYKLSDLSAKTYSINTNNNISKEILSFNNKENMLYNYHNYKHKKDKSNIFKKCEDQKNSATFLIPHQESHEKNYSKFNRIKIEEYYRNNMNINYGNNHKINKINLINKKHKKNHCIMNLYTNNNNTKIDVTGNFNNKQKMVNMIKASINNNFKNIKSNSSNNIICINDKNIYKNKPENNNYNYKSAHKKILNLTHRTENSIQKVMNNIITKI